MFQKQQKTVGSRQVKETVGQGQIGRWYKRGTHVMSFSYNMLEIKSLTFVYN
ncbi:hypothetical protein Sjap_013398 [Stephania japonica]|uniref:Uncharacterized protein n=1 Tax=Stephania japonica TaxID=461633 RepID=A0AAP0J0B0_9MAGN